MKADEEPRQIERDQPITGKVGAESVNPALEDRYWEENHPRQTFIDPGLTYDDYRPAYRMGYEGPARYRKSWDESQVELEDEWAEVRGKSRLTWQRAKNAVRAAWHRVEEKLSGDGR